MRRPQSRALLILVLLLSTSRTTTAQVVSGTLRLAGSGRPSSGTVVVAERLTDGQVITRGVSGAQGTYQLRITTDRLVVRALRIGFEPHVLDTVHLAVGEERELNAVLSSTAVVLSTVRTAADSRCRVRPDSASLVARVFQDARTALAASQLVAPDGPLRTRVRLGTEIWDTRRRRMLESSHREYFSDSLRPFVTTSVDSLLEFGFVTRTVEHVAGFRYPIETAVAYRIPSVDLLVDDRFLADYCLNLADARDDHPDWIGVGYRPARNNRRITQIEGTLWVDKRTSELRRLEFGYAGLKGSETSSNLGGWLEFTRLENGLWFVNRWAVRLPSLAERVERSGQATVRIAQRFPPVVRTSGEVLDLAVDSRAVFTVGATEFVEAGALVPLPMPVDSLQTVCGGRTGSAFLVGTVRSASGTGFPDAELRFFWRDPGGAGEDWAQVRAIAESTGQYHLCDLPRDQLVIVEARASGHEAASITLRVSAPRSSARLDLVLVPTASDPLPR